MTGKPKYFLFPHQELYLTYNTLTFARHFHSSLASSRVKTGLEGKVSFFENLSLFYRNKMQISNFRPMPVVWSVVSEIRSDWLTHAPASDVL